MNALLVASLMTVATAAQADLTLFTGTFGPEAVGATGSGTLTMQYDDQSHTLAINATFAGLSGNTNNAHIHCCTLVPRTGTASVALAQSGLLPGFPLGVSSGSYVRTIDLTQQNQYNATFFSGSGGTAAGAELRLISNLKSGQAYFNIHSTTFGGGEIRSFVTAVPEPASYALMALGLAVVGGIARRRAAG